MSEVLFNVAKEFSPVPFGRDGKSGDANGKKFRENFLLIKMNKHPDDTIILDFSDVEVPPGTSFIDEVFAKLVLECNMTKEKIFNSIGFKENKYFTVKNMAEERVDRAIKSRK